jgi:hypothetical protein
MALALFNHDALAEDATVPPGGGGFRGAPLAYNTRAKEEVDEIMKLADSHSHLISWRNLTAVIELITAGRISRRRQIAANKAEKLTTRSSWRVRYLLPSSHIGLSSLRRAKFLCGAKPAIGQRASFGVR